MEGEIKKLISVQNSNYDKLTAESCNNEQMKPLLSHWVDNSVNFGFIVHLTNRIQAQSDLNKKPKL